MVHGCARTTEAVRRTIQNSQESNVIILIQKLWKKRSLCCNGTSFHSAHSRRRGTLLPLDDSLQVTIPHLTRSSLHRCLQRHGISRLPYIDGETKAKKKFKQYPVDYFHINIAEVRTEEGKLFY
jgi:hypothetical protein